MNKKHCVSLLALTVTAVNLVLILTAYKGLPSDLPSHYDLDGSYTSTMPKATLLCYPAVSLVLFLLLALMRWLVFRFIPRADDPWGIRSSYVSFVQLCVAAIILCSTCVTLTSGSCHLFFFAEPVFLLLALLAVIMGEVRLKKRKSLS